MKVIAVLGVGPGLGLSIAKRWAAEGYSVAMVSRSPTRHESYLDALPPRPDQPHAADLMGPAVPHKAYAADVTDPGALGKVLAEIEEDLGPIDAVYFGPAAAGRSGIVPLPEADAEALREPIELLLLPLATVIATVLPGMLERGDGTILIPTGLSGLRALPSLGNLAPASAALRMYALTLAASVADRGVHVGALTIGGLITGGDIHQMVTATNPGLPTLDPEEIASAAWGMVIDRTNELVFDRMP
jgi:NAD(P)-dependent dehydrogenase (short-subunit alcohol dehydrogenase family)